MMLLIKVGRQCSSISRVVVIVVFVTFANNNERRCWSGLVDGAVVVVLFVKFAMDIGAGSDPHAVHKNDNVAEGAHLEDWNDDVAEGEFVMEVHILHYAWMTEDPIAP